MRQIKLKHWISLLLLPLAAFYGCNVEEIGRGDDTPLPEGVTRLTATVGTGLKTRAVGDLLGDATNDEKRIDRLAFFVHTEAEGMQVYEPAKAGETYADFPNKVQLDATNPTDPSAGYTATVDLITGAGYDADIIAVANLPEDYDYSQIISWQGLLDSVTVGTFTASMPLCTGNDGAGHNNAFVMCGSTTVPLHKEKEETFSLALERLTARIDITNEAYVAGMTDDDPKGGFLLTGVRILHARPQSYIVPQMDYVSPDVATVSDWKATADQIRLVKVDADNATDVTEGTPEEQATATCQRIWHALYTYENHESEHAPTGLEITGKFRGMPITRQIPFEVTEADGTKRAVPVVRNHRYLVSIKPAPGQTDLTYSVQVGEWNAVDTINVQPNQDQVPVVTNVVCAEATKSYGGDLAGGTAMPDTLVVPADGATLTFRASCPFDTRVTTDYFSPEDGSSWLEVTSRSEATVTKGDISMARNYTITIKQNIGLDPSLVNRGYLYIANGANGSVMDTVVVYQGADIPYADTRFAPIPMGQVNGKDVIWAPVNVGATEIATKITADETTPEEKAANEQQCGYYFQWGRKVPFRYGGEKEDLAPTTIKLVTYAEATKPDYQYADKFISVGGDWFSDYETFSKNWPKENDPCPVGWRVPTKDELQILLTQATSSPTKTDGVWISPTNGAFALPASGYRYKSSPFQSMDRGTEVVYWSATFENGKGYRLNLTNDVPTLEIRTFSYGYPIRCVKE